VPSNQRASAIEQYGEKMGDGLKDEGDGWFSTAEAHSGRGEAEDIPNIDGSPTGGTLPAKGEEDDDDDDIPDIDDLALDDDEVDEVHVAALLISIPPPHVPVPPSGVECH
jgi:hypothetical protein